MLLTVQILDMTIGKTSSNEPVMSNAPLSDAEHHELVMKPLRETPLRYWSLLNDRWLNFSEEAQAYFIDVLLRDDKVAYKGSVLSPTRKQIEITLLFNEPNPCGADSVRFCVTVDRFEQLLASDE